MDIRKLSGRIGTACGLVAGVLLVGCANTSEPSGKITDYININRLNDWMLGEGKGRRDSNIVCPSTLRRSAVNADADRRVVEMTPLAERGDIKAQVRLGDIYNARSGLRNRHTAWAWRQCAADAGNAEAQYKVGSMYAEFSTQEAKVNEAIKWYTLSAEQDYVKAQEALAFLYRDLRADEAAARQWLARATANGSEVAKRELDRISALEEQERQKIDAARQKKRQAEALARQKAAEELARRKAADERSRAKAAADMARRIAEGELAMKRAAEERARKKAAQELSNRQQEAEEAKPSEEELRATEAKRFNDFMEKAESGDSDAQFEVAHAYNFGKGVEKDISQALEWYRKSAEQENVKAFNRLSVFYSDGEGVEKDAVEAAKWTRRAAEKGDGDAQHRLGAMYRMGDGVAKDYEESVRWQRTAAEQGNPHSQEILANMYMDGLGVGQDNLQAYKWLEIAISKARPSPMRTSWQRRQALLAKRLTPEDIAEAKRQAGEWTPKSAADAAAIASGAPAKETQTQASAAKTPEEETKTAEPAAERDAALTLPPPAAERIGPDTPLGAMLTAYVDSLNARDFKALRGLMTDKERLKCAVDDNEEAYNAYLSKKLPAKIPPEYTAVARPVGAKSPLPVSGLMSFPVRPTHYLTIETKTAQAEPGSTAIILGETLIQYAVRDGGKWRFAFGCPTAEGFKALRKAKSAG